jgi:hypothetical protein
VTARRGGAAAASLLLLVAQQAQAGGWFRLSPSLTVGQAHDDNVFSSSTDPQGDWITRADPGLSGEYRAPALWVTGRYSFGAERFRENPELNRVLARQEGGFNIEGDASPRVKLNARGAYAQTYTPADLVLAGGLDLGRVRTERLDTGAGLTWRTGTQSEAIFDYGFIHDQVAGGLGLGGDAHTARVRLERKATARDTLRAGYALRRFSWSGGAGLDSHVVTVGWTREVGPRTRMGLSVGPRLASGRPVELEAEASLRIGLRGGELAVTGAQTETRVVGIAEPAVTQDAAVHLGVEPSRHWRLGLEAGLYRTRFTEGSVLVHRLGFDVAWRVAPWLSLEVVPRWTHQATGSGVAAFRDLDRRVLLFRVVTAAPPRVRPPAAPRGPEPVRPETEGEGGERP